MRRGAAARRDPDLLWRCAYLTTFTPGIAFQNGYFECRMLTSNWSPFWFMSRSWMLTSTVPPYVGELDVLAETDLGGGANYNCALHKNTSGPGGVPDQVNNGNNNNWVAAGSQITGQWHTFASLPAGQLPTSFLGTMSAQLEGDRAEDQSAMMIRERLPATTGADQSARPAVGAKLLPAAAVMVPTEGASLRIAQVGSGDSDDLRLVPSTAVHEYVNFILLSVTKIINQVAHLLHQL